jgi:UDP-N-acetyl-D-mannosaminuronic acid dehydrogenase
MSYVEQAARAILPHLRSGNLVVLESTSPPGTTEGLLTGILLESGLIPGKDLFVAHCPERVMPGRVLAELVENDRVVGGIDEESARRAASMYRRAVDGEVFETSAIVAELVKLFENAYRDVSIAFANELARVSRRWEADPADVIRLANRHPRVQILRPGPGVGGHCIPVDPWFLVGSSPEQAQLIRAARMVNDSQPTWVAERTMAELAGVRDPKVSVWGVAYKGNTSDARETPALQIIEILESKGVRVSVVDSHVRQFKYRPEDVTSSVTQADCILLLADHREFASFEPDAIGQRMRRRLLFDTRSLLPKERWERAGFRVVTL